MALRLFWLRILRACVSRRALLLGSCILLLCAGLGVSFESVRWRLVLGAWCLSWRGLVVRRVVLSGFEG